MDEIARRDTAAAERTASWIVGIIGGLIIAGLYLIGVLTAGEAWVAVIAGMVSTPFAVHWFYCPRFHDSRKRG